MRTTHTETARLVLDFMKTLAWPLIVLLALIVFYGPLHKFLSNVKNVSGPGGFSASTATGTRPDNLADSPDKSKHPDIWFSLRDVSSLRNTTCVELGKAALRQSGFAEIQDTTQGVAYGYNDGYVGAVSCGPRQDLASIMVAGPYEGIVDRHKKLDDAFLSGIPAPALPQN